MRARASCASWLRPAHIVEGPHPIDGAWSFEPDGAGTRVHFVADGELRGAMRMLRPVAKLLIGRQMAGYHENLRRNVEAGERSEGDDRTS
jgi:hypothetical protein